jgi:leucyl aminopeptidase (aminopeptidase T)
MLLYPIIIYRTLCKKNNQTLERERKEKTVKKYLQTIRNMYTLNLNVKKGEHVLVFTDNVEKDLENITKLVAKEGKKFTPHVNVIRYTNTGSHGEEPPGDLWKAAFGSSVFTSLTMQNLLKPLLKKQLQKKQLRQIEKIVRKYRREAVTAVIALSYYSTSHTRFRTLLTRICRCRYASMPLFDTAMLSGAMSVDWNTMARRTKRIARKVNACDQVQIETPNGTFITLSKKGRKAESDTGIITRPGDFSNLPAGEVYCAPLEGTAEGRLVLDWAPTRRLKEPITLSVRKGMVTRVGGTEEYAKHLRKKLRQQRGNANIAELGIGTNDRARRPDNILESEKILGTIHIALGDNSTFGGMISTPFHQDFVFFHPTVTLIRKDGKRDVLLSKGSLL